LYDDATYRPALDSVSKMWSELLESDPKHLLRPDMMKRFLMYSLSHSTVIRTMVREDALMTMLRVIGDYDNPYFEDNFELEISKPLNMTEYTAIVEGCRKFHTYGPLFDLFARDYREMVEAAVNNGACVDYGFTNQCVDMLLNFWPKLCETYKVLSSFNFQDQLVDRLLSTQPSDPVYDIVEDLAEAVVDYMVRLAGGSSGH
jgi:hypothetical protein